MEFCIGRLDGRKSFQRLGLQSLFHGGQAHAAFIFVIVKGLRRRTALCHAVLFVGNGGCFFRLFGFFLERNRQVGAHRVGIRLVVHRRLGKHGFQIKDFAQLHAAFVQRVRPVYDGGKGHRAFAKPGDHGVAAGLDALGNGDFALAGQQLDCAHLAQVHAHRVIGSVQLFLGRGNHRSSGNRIDFINFRCVLLFGFGIFAGVFILDNIDAHVAQRRHHILDLLGRHLVLRQRLVQLFIGQPAALFRLGEQPLEAGFVQINYRGAIALRLFRSIAFGKLGLRHAGLSLIERRCARPRSPVKRCHLNRPHPDLHPGLPKQTSGKLLPAAPTQAIAADHVPVQKRPHCCNHAAAFQRLCGATPAETQG